MVPVGDEDVVGGRGGADGRDARRVGDPLDDVLDAVDGDRADRLARLGEQGGEAGASERPQTGDRLACVARVRSRRSVDALGVVRSWGEDVAGALVDDLERAEHAAQVALLAGRVGEAAAGRS